MSLKLSCRDLALPTVLLAALLAPAVATAGDGWLEDEKNGCKVWARNVEPGDSVVWNGDCQNGYAEGRATYIFSLNGKWTWKGEAEFHEGKREGQGSAESADGIRIEGRYRNGVLSGRVIETDGETGRYVGEYFAGERSGAGRYTFANGDYFEGGFKAGLPNGQGTYVGHNSIGSVTQYVGTWRDGCFVDRDRTAAVLRTRKECGFE